MDYKELNTGQEVEIKMFDGEQWVWVSGRVADPYSTPPFIELSDGMQVQPKASRIRPAKKRG